MLKHLEPGRIPVSLQRVYQHQNDRKPCPPSEQSCHITPERIWSGAAIRAEASEAGRDQLIRDLEFSLIETFIARADHGGLKRFLGIDLVHNKIELLQRQNTDPVNTILLCANGRPRQPERPLPVQRGNSFFLKGMKQRRSI